MSSHTLIPSWVVTPEDKKLYGAAIRKGANETVLSDRDITLGFLEELTPGSIQPRTPIKDNRRSLVSITPNVVSNPSVRSRERTLQQLYDVVNSCGVRIKYNDQELTQLTISDLEMLLFTDTSHKNKKSTFIPLQEVLKALSLEDKEIDILTSRELYRNFSRLKDEKESFLKADKGYQSLKRKVLYYDSHSRPKVFNNPRVNSKTIKTSAYEIDFSAKPDGIHYYFPSYLEIKGKGATHLECLTQGLNRILASISSYGLFAKHFVFVVENSFSFIIFCDLQRSGNPVIRISLVSLDDLCTVLLKLNANVVENQDYYAHRHSLTVLQVYDSLNKKLFNGEMSLMFSQIVKIAQSSSIVFKILFNNSKTVDSLENKSVIIKINDNLDRFNTEKSAILKMDGYYRKKPKEYFIIGYCEPNSDVVLLNRSKHYLGVANETVVDPSQIGVKLNEQKVKNDVALTGSLAKVSLIDGNSDHEGQLLGWFDGHYNFSSSSSCGLIIMEEGQTLSEFTQEICLDLLCSLGELHEMRILHRDLRSSNFLYFPQLKRSYVIDYDLAAILPTDEFSTPTTISRSSGQGQRAPLKYRNELQQHRNPINVYWSFDDDVVMLCEYASSKGISIKYEHHHHI